MQYTKFLLILPDKNVKMKWRNNGNIIFHYFYIKRMITGVETVI